MLPDGRACNRNRRPWERSLAPELARVDKRMKPQMVTELVNYKSRMVPFMPGRRIVDKERAFFAIFSTMMGAIDIARILPDPAIREKVGKRERFSLAQLLTF